METAIILMAFVVVASIYAFTVLSTGIFSADKGKETIHAGLGEAGGPVELEGSAVGEGSPAIPPPFGESLRTAVATSSSGYQAGPTADTIDKKEDSAGANIAPSATSSIHILAPRASPPLSLIVDLDSPSALDQPRTPLIIFDMKIPGIGGARAYSYVKQLSEKLSINQRTE
jgi:hypothetical protein